MTLSIKKLFFNIRDSFLIVRQGLQILKRIFQIFDIETYEHMLGCGFAAVVFHTVFIQF
jgi:hypothetical protein